MIAQLPNPDNAIPVAKGARRRRPGGRAPAASIGSDLSSSSMSEA